MNRMLLLFGIVVLLFSCVEKEKKPIEKKLTKEEIIEMNYKFAYYEVEDHQEITTILSFTENIKKDTINSILREYIYESQDLDENDSIGFINSIEKTAVKYSLKPKIVADIVFKYKSLAK